MENGIEFYRQNFGTFNINYYLQNNSGCSLWLKADSLITVNGSFADSPNDGDSVKGWYSAAGYHQDFAWQQYAPYRPIYRANALNGLPVISFTKENSQSIITQQNANYNIFTPSIFLVGKWYSGGYNSGFFGKGSNSGGINSTDVRHRKMCISIIDSGNVFWSSGNDDMHDTQRANALSVATTNWNIYSIIAQRNNLMNVNVNGVDNFSIIPVNNSTFNPDNFGLGCSFPLAGAEFATCDIAELIVFNFSAPDFLKQHIINYLSLKWGIAVTNTVPAEIPTRGAYVERAGF